MVTVERLKEVLDYNPDTGVWTWRERPGNSWFGGRRAGWQNTGGHNQITIDGRDYMSSRLAVLYMTGVWPAVHVDHENTVRNDDRWVNLRCATRVENQRNRRTPVNNALGIKGVSYLAYRTINTRYRARIFIDGKRVHLGYFRTAKGAQRAYWKKAQEVFGEFARAA